MSEGDIPEKIRQQVYHRDRYRCRLCGVTNALSYSVHHLEYRSQGGKNDLSNLILLCGSGSQGCHLLVHSDKNFYAPLLEELLTLHGSITGVALARQHKRQEATDVTGVDRIQRRF